MGKEYTCTICKEVFNEASNSHDYDCVSIFELCTDCLGHCPMCYVDMKEKIASIIFDHEDETYERPTEEQCHLIADNIIMLCGIYNEQGQKIWKGECKNAG